MTSLIEALKHAKMESLLCDMCKANTEVDAANLPEAAVRCLICEENLCECCLKLHQTFKLMRDHKIAKIGKNFQVEEAVMNLQTMNCDIHRGKVLDYYCTECKKVVCVSCFDESHSKHDCKDVNTVEEEFRQVIGRTSTSISKLAEELLIKKTKLGTREDFLKKMNEREQGILQRSEELKEMIDKHTKSLLSSLDEIKNRRLKEIQVREDEMDRQLISVESFKRYCDELISKGSASDICRSKDKVLQRAEVIEEDHESYIMRPLVSFDVTFDATDLDNMLTTTNGNIIGKLKNVYIDTVFDRSILRTTNDDSEALLPNELGLNNITSSSLAFAFPTYYPAYNSIAKGCKRLLDLHVTEAETLKNAAPADADPAKLRKAEDETHRGKMKKGKK